MSVTPDELANLCAIFQQLNTRYLGGLKLQQHIASTLRVDSDVTAESVINEAVSCGLIRRGGGNYVATGTGLEVGKSQSAVESRITDKARRALIKHVYLNPKARTRCCGTFLQTWIPDSILGTFVYHRGIGETDETLSWLQTLERVGLIVVDTERAFVRTEHLAAVNDVLAHMRGVQLHPRGITGVLRQDIGDVGEELAMKYEQERLRQRGHATLVPLIQRISLVDNSAGYDVISCRGGGHTPESRIYIEVKGTSDPAIQFTWSFNEQIVAQRYGTNYWIYCFTDIDLTQRSGKGPYRINDPARRVKPPKYQVEARDVFVQKA